MGEEKASAEMHREGPERPRKRGRGRSVSIVSFDVLSVKADKNRIKQRLKERYIK